MAPMRDTLISARPISTPPLNRKYLRAFHDYQPSQSTLSGSTGGVSVTVPLKEGDIVLVHLTHANGWADGTVLQSGARGWIPTNFCQAFDHPFIRSLMHGLTQLWDYLSSEGGGKAMVDERQDYVQGLIAGVRRLLEHCDCLHRDDDLIQKHIGIRRTRKSLLAELTSLIKCRDQIQGTFSTEISSDVSWATIDDYMGKAFKVACRGVRFLDLWIQSAAPRRLRIMSSFDESIEPGLPSTTTASFSPTSPAHLKATFVDDIGNGMDSRPGAPDPTVNEQSLRSYRDSQSSRPQSTGADSVAKHLSSFHTGDIDTWDLSQSYADHRRSSPVLGFRPDRSSDLSSIVEAHGDSHLASDQLSAAHDNLLGHIGAFLGLHLQSRTSLDLASATQRSLQACTSLIAVTKAIRANDPQRSQEVSFAMINLQETLDRLADVARKLCKNSDPAEDPALLRPEQSKSLVVAATACVRSAGECTAKARQLLDQNGDFEVDVEEIHQDQTGAQVSPEETKASRGFNDNEVDDLSVVHETEEDNLNCGEKLHMPGQTSSDKHIPIHTRSATAGPTDIAPFAFTSEARMRSASSPEPLAIQTTIPGSPPADPASLGTPVTPNSFLKSPWTASMRKESLGLSATESASTYQNSLRYSNGSARSPTSTRATTPDRPFPPSQLDPTVLNSFASISSMRSVITAGSDGSETEAEILARSYAHELLFNKEGQILGGTLRALVEKLTSQHSPPDPTFVNTFYLTFRLFTNSVGLTQALLDRYQYVGESKIESMPARLRVYNFMKGWLESYWLSEYDGEALDTIRTFATEQVLPLLPAPGQRLLDLVEKAARQKPTNATNQLVNPLGKISAFAGAQFDKENIPNAVITKSQLNLLRLAQPNSPSSSILDYDPLEIARQFTLIQSRTFCAIEPQELVNLNWTKNAGNAVNVRAMARFATDLTNLVADSILAIDEVRKRALCVKQWIKVGKACLELSNYDCIMAIVCSLTSSTIMRLRATWEQVPQRWKTQFDEIKNVVDVSRNYAVLRQRLQSPKAPCLPFVGIYLTDLTFVDAGNQDTRILPNSDDTVQPVEIINFDKHMRTARIISQLQRNQVPYRLQPVVELQGWLEGQLARVRASDDCSMQNLWRRSLQLEPKSSEAEGEARPGTSAGGSGSFRLGHKVSKSGLNGVFNREKLDFLSNLGFKSEGELKAKISGTL